MTNVPSKIKYRRTIFVVFLYSTFVYSCLAQTNLEQTNLNQLLEKTALLTSEGNYEKSTKLCLQIIEKAKINNNWKSCSAAYKQIFYNGYFSGNFPNSIKILEKEKKQIPKNQLLPFAKINFYLGYSYNEIGNVLASLKAYETTIHPFQIEKEFDELNKIYGNIGIAYTQIGDYSKAISYLESAVNLGRSLDDTLTLRNNFENLAAAYMHQGDLEKAEINFRKSNSLVEFKDGTFEYNMAEINLENGNFAKAEIEINKAINLRKKNKLTFFEEEKILGNILLNSNRPKLAFSIFQKVLPQFKKSTNLRELGKIYILMADSKFESNEIDQTLSFLQKAILAFIPNFTNPNSELNPSMKFLNQEIWLIEIFNKKGDCFWEKYLKTKDLKWLSLANENYFLSVELTQKIKLNFDGHESKVLLREHTHAFYEKLLQTKLELFSHKKDKNILEDAFNIAQKSTAFILRELITEKKAVEIANIPNDTIELMKDLQIKIEGCQNKIYDNLNLDSLNEILFELNQDRFELSKEIEKKYPKYNFLRKKIEIPTVLQVQENLDYTSLIIKYFLGKNSLYIFSISKNDFQVDTVFLPRDFYKTVNQFRRTISDFNFIQDSAQLAEKRFLASSFDLYKILLEKPLSYETREKNINQINIISDGILNTIPFQALLLRETDTWENTSNYLISKYAVGYSFFCKNKLDDSHKINLKNKFISFGLENSNTLNQIESIKMNALSFVESDQNNGPNYLSILPFADDEAKEIARLMDGKYWLNENATKSNFVKNAPSANLIHLATHSLMNYNNPGQSSLVFFKSNERNDNLLRASEIFNLDLTQSKLIVLSACKTGYGKNQMGEGLNSIARAFNSAGIPNVLATNWSISDEVSEKIMKLFYKFLKEGNSINFALQKAQVEFLINDKISSPAFRMPLYWAAWMPFGENQKIFLGVEQSDFGNQKILGLLILILLFLSILFFKKLKE